MASTALPSSKHQPVLRVAHTSGSIREKLIVYAGRIPDYSEKSKERLSSFVEVFDPYCEVWDQHAVIGQTPAIGVYSAACASVNNDLYMFGGFDGTVWLNSLHRLKHVIGTYYWKELSPDGVEAGHPMRKSGCGMVIFNDTLVLFGGYGIPHSPNQPGKTFIKNARFKDGRGLTNELHLYHLQKGVWISPVTTGERPPPYAGFSFTMIDSRRAVMYAGYSPRLGRTNDVHIIDLQNMHWTKLNKLRGCPWPEARVHHAACCLNFDQEHPQLLVTGGLNRGNKALGDIWILDIDRTMWREELKKIHPHSSHSATAFTMGPELTEVTMFGGPPEVTTGYPKLVDTTLLKFEHNENCWVLTSVVGPQELGCSEERVKKRMSKRNISSQRDEASLVSSEYTIDIDDLHFGEALGQGTYGTVFCGRWKSKNVDVALKKFKNPNTTDGKILRNLGKHPNIVPFYGFAHRYPDTFIVLGLAKNGSLYDYLHIKKERPSQLLSVVWAKQIAYGMVHIHTLDYIHRDLKSRNILFTEDMVAQVCDFGLPRPLLETTIASKVAGTLRWMAPEVAENNAIDKQCDVFSFSLILWELLEHKIPFHDIGTDILASIAIVEGKRPPIRSNWPKYLSSLVQSCWAQRPSDRPPFTDIVISLENEICFRR